MDSIPKRIFIYFVTIIAKILIYLAPFTEFVVQLLLFSWEIYKKTEVGVFLLKHTVYVQRGPKEVRPAHIFTSIFDTS